MNENDRANDPVMEWLGAYLDGELTGPRLTWVESHLAGCLACQRELENMRALSSLLHADPEPVPAVDTRAFANQVVRGLADRGRQPRGRLVQAGLRYTPMGLFAIWAFFQAVIGAASLLLLGLTYLPGAQMLLGGLLPLAREGSGGYLQNLLGGLLSETGYTGLLETLNLLQQLPWLSTMGLLSLALAGLMAGLFAAWLAGYWSHCRLNECAS